MDTPFVFSKPPTGGQPGLPVPLDGEIIPPHGRARAEQTARPVPPASTAKPNTRGIWAGTLLIGVTLAGLVGLGAAGGYYFWDRTRALDATILSLHQVQHEVVALKSGVEAMKSTGEIARQDDTIRGLKKSVEALKAELDAARTTSASANAQLTARIERADHDPSTKLADMSSRLDKLESPGAKLGEMAARLDRIERQVSSPLATGSIAAPRVQAVVQQTTPPVEKPQPKPAPLGTWILRDVYDGIALVEGRNGGIREVTPGEMLPGAGEVRAIERRGRGWIVVTSRGIIDDTTW